jgi:hypothetical protein
MRSVFTRATKMRTLLLLLPTVLLLSGCSRPSDHKEDSPQVMIANAQRALENVAAVKPDIQFRVYRRRPENNYWDDGTAYPHTNALAILKAVSNATPWDGSNHAAAYGQWHAHTPGIRIGLAWWTTEAEKKTNAIHFCYGNWLFWYGGWVFQTSKEGHDTLDAYFPENRQN